MSSEVITRKPASGLSAAVALRDYGIYFALVALIAYFSIRVPEFRTWDNALLILLQVSVIGIIAIGMTFTIITAGIDLSVGSLLAVAGIMSGLFAQREPTAVNMLLAFTVPIAVGILGGACNGLIIAGAGVNPLIVTLGTLTAFRGFVVWYRVNPIYDLQPYYRVVGQGTVFGIPIPVLFLVAMAVGAWIVLTHTRFGRYVYAVGGNREAARAAGINVALITFAVYVISGFCVGLAALIFTSRLMAAQAISGMGFELQAIAAAVVGGASLFGGRGRISNTIVGALIMGVLFNGFVMLDVPQPIQQMSVGVIIIAAVWLDGFLRKRRG
ncbi:MAG: putative xylitol transport system permease protein [Rhodospirillaceae bacterium]|jgi:ribose/xylose/arabinose/galactoside ABC-type transport system permease subunit|nr:putative xylitol transport system permease protein [Rhodospirillaceae bacterium]